jgi:hypothetical protein
MATTEIEDPVEQRSGASAATSLSVCYLLKWSHREEAIKLYHKECRAREASATTHNAEFRTRQHLVKGYSAVPAIPAVEYTAVRGRNLLG